MSDPGRHAAIQTRKYVSVKRTYYKINVIHTKTLEKLCIVFPIWRDIIDAETVLGGDLMLTLEMVREAQEA